MEHGFSCIITAQMTGVSIRLDKHKVHETFVTDYILNYISLNEITQAAYAKPALCSDEESNPFTNIQSHLHLFCIVDNCGCHVSLIFNFNLFIETGDVWRVQYKSWHKGRGHQSENNVSTFCPTISFSTRSSSWPFDLLCQSHNPILSLVPQVW